MEPNCASWETGAKLLIALRYGTLEQCRQLLIGGADPDEMFKINIFKPAIHLGVERRSSDFVELLLESGCAVDRRDSEGRTALNVAIDLGYDNIAELLLLHRADVNLQDDQGYSPLHHAVKRRSLRIIELLLRKGADVSRRDANGNTPLLLINDGFYSSASSYEIIKLLLQNGARADEIDERGVSLLWNALRCGNFTFRTVQLLLQNGASADLLVPQCSSNAPIHLVILSSNEEKWKCLEAMLIHGCDVNLKTIKKQTPLHLAVQMKDLESVRILLRAGADPNTVDCLGFSPLGHAITLQIKQLVFLLVKGGARLSGDEFDSMPIRKFMEDEGHFLRDKLENAMTLKELSRIALWKVHGPNTSSWLRANPDWLPNTLVQFLNFD